MFNWISNKARRHEPAPARRVAQPIKTTIPKADEDFAYPPSLIAGAIEVEEVSIDEFLHYFHEK